MINQHKKIITEEKDIIDNVICNRCGEPINTTKNMCGDIMYVDYIHCKNNIIYKEYLPTYIETFDLCEKCIDEIINNFKIPVKKIEL
jgi:hypothetical protein